MSRATTYSSELVEVTIPPGEFRSFNFKRSDIPLAGEPGTGRLQVRGTLTVIESGDASRARGDRLPLALEVVDNRTGKTAALSPYSPLLIEAKILLPRNN